MKTCLLILVAVTVAYCLPADIYKVEWEKFKLKFNRHYSLEEEEFRFKLFCETLDMVTKHNEDYANGKTSFKMGINQFSDLTSEEKKKWLRTRYPQEIEEAENSYLPDDVYKTEWEKFKVKYNRHYSPDEEEFRFKIFCETLDLVTKHNEDYDKGKTSFKMGINFFADLTPEERRRWLITLETKEVKNSYLPDDVYETEWEKFKDTYNKLYDSPEEEKHRFQIFCDNLDKIYRHNELYNKGLVTDKMGVNKFADLTQEEFKKMMGLKPVRRGEENEASANFKSEFEAFKKRFNKHYATPKEEDHRFAVFSENMVKIVRHNQDYEKGLTSYKMGVTMFTDMTKKEYIDWLKEEAGHHTWAPPHH